MVARDIGQGLFVLNPITIKKFETDHYPPLMGFIRKIMNEIRMGGFPYGDPDKIRMRNAGLQRLNQAQSFLESAAREKKVKL